MNTTNEKIKLTIEELLLSLIDYPTDILKTAYKRYPSIYNKIRNYQKQRKINKDDYYTKLWYLEKKGYIKKFIKNKKNIIKVSKIGQKKILKYLSNNYKIEKPKIWDKKWRIIIFDIPEEKSNIRKTIRIKLKNLGFYQLQKSVWVHPFECQELIYSLKYIYSLGSYLKYITAESIEAEINLVDHFYKNKILNNKI